MALTLFVSNLPYNATSTDLKTAFSDLAPVRTAFVVLEHGSGVSKGVGYVSFAIKEDAQAAFESITTDGLSINGRSLRVQWAESKPKDKRKDATKKESETRQPPLQKTKDPLAIRTVVISGLPLSINQKTLWKKLRKFDGADNVEWPVKTSAGEDPSTAHALFSSSSLAQDAIDKLHAHVFKGSLLSATLKKRLDTIKKTSEALPSRASRLIVRNLPFDITEQDLRAIFLPYGPIHSVHIPSADADDAGASSKTARSKGFAFVWMLSKKDAESALEKCNGIKVVAGMADGIVSNKQKRKKQRREEKKHQDSKTEDGEEPEDVGSGGKERVIAVDWALSKERWEKEKEKFVEAVYQDDDAEMDDAGSQASASGSDNEHEPLGFHDEHLRDEEEEYDNDSNVMDEPDSDDDSPQKPHLPHTDTGNTLFIRNVPFTATEDEIRTLFRAFGPLRYVRLTIDPETERPKGTGFACFWNKADADKAIQQSEILREETMGTQTQLSKNPFSLPSLLTPDPSAGVAKNLVLHGRTLDVVRAVTREEATKLKEDGEKSREKADKRNLYLLREGVILPNCPAATTISQAELEKRTNSFNARRTMLRSNPSLYVSKTRLSIRQIPLFVSERVLKRLAMHSVRTFNAEVKKGTRENLSPDERACPVDQEEPAPSKRRGVKQAKIVRQTDRVDVVTGKGRSRGYGFIEMQTHADALRVLRWANNNPGVIALCDAWWREELAECVARADEVRAKRMRDEMAAPARDTRGALIVEFSIENVQVVRRRTTKRVSKDAEEPPTKKRRVSEPDGVVKEESVELGKRRTAQGDAQEPPTKKQRVRFELVKEESVNPGKSIGLVIGRKRKARKAGKGTQ